MITIEYVCTGNNGRSPMAEAIAKDTIMNWGLANRVTVMSSGSGLHPSTMKTGEELARQKQGMVRLALDSGIYQEPWRRRNAELVAAVDAMVGYSEELEEFFNYAVRVEGIFRDQALMEVGLVATGQYHKLTVAHVDDADRRVILPMAASNASQVRQIYAGFENQPRVLTPLNEYAGMEGDVPNPFCQLLPAYRSARNHLMVAVPKTVERAVRELS
ncbi:MAG: hypothetical protein AABX37_02800 [Nanoarchaeota archaeon]